MTAARCANWSHIMSALTTSPHDRWRLDAAQDLCADLVSPVCLNGSRHVSHLYRPSSTRSHPDSNPQPTGWWTMASGPRETKPDAFEWAVHGVYRQCFYPRSAIQSSVIAAGALFPRASTGSMMDGCLARITPQLLCQKSTGRAHHFQREARTSRTR